MAEIRFSATTEEYDTKIFRSEAEFEAYKKTLWKKHSFGHQYEAWVLRDDKPSRFPCMMLSAGERELQNRQDEIQNIFLYDVEILDDKETED